MGSLIGICLSCFMFMHKICLMPILSKCFLGIILQVSCLHLISLQAQTAFIAMQKVLKSIIFSPPFEISFISTFLAILSLLYFHKKSEKLFIYFFYNPFWDMY